MKFKIFVIIPAFNEEKTISWVLERVPKIDNYEIKTMVIDDGSTDRTAKIAEHHGAIVIQNEKNLGLGQTMLKGLEEALEREADIIISLDADGQYDPFEIPKMLKGFEYYKKQGVDLILGTRLRNIEFRFNSLNKLGNILISKLVSFFISRATPISDTQAGFRVVSKELAQILVKKMRGKYTYTQEMIIHAKFNNYNIAEVPIHFYQRRGGESRLVKNPMIYLLKVIVICAKTYLNYKITRQN